MNRFIYKLYSPNTMIDLMIRVLDFASPILVMVFVGLFATGLLIEMGLMKHFSGFSRPLFKYINLPDTCGSAFLVAIGSTVAANSMVVKAREDHCLDEREMMLCALLNSTPAYIREIVTYQIPIILPALGPIVGGFYVMVFIITAMVKMLVVIVLSRLWFTKRTCSIADNGNDKRPRIREALVKAFRKNRKLFLKIAVIYISMTTLVFALQERGTFEIFNVLPLADLFGIPPQSIIPLTTYIASPIMGVSLLGPMIGDGSISYIQAMIVLMIGSMFMLPILSVRAILPRYVSIFGLRLGVKIVTLSTGISIVVRFVILVVLLSLTL